MPVLEICLLKVKPSISPTSPLLLTSLQKVRTTLATRITNTASRFYQSLEDPTEIYILGIWPTLAAHHTFLASPEKAEILDAQQDLLDFGWILHIPIESMDEVPFDAPVMAITRLFVKGEHVRRYKEVGAKYREKVVEGTKPFRIVNGWRVDGEEGRLENVILTGWETREAHFEFTAAMVEKFPEYGTVKDCCEGMELSHCVNMEK